MDKKIYTIRFYFSPRFNSIKTSSAKDTFINNLSTIICNFCTANEIFIKKIKLMKNTDSFIKITGTHDDYLKIRAFLKSPKLRPIIILIDCKR